MSYETGRRAELFVFDIFQKANIKYEFEDDWYDVKLKNGELLEIKSCGLSIKHPKLSGDGRFRVGRFDFTSEENKQRLEEHNAWLCFVVRFKAEFMLCGLARAEEMKKLGKKRYVSIHDLRRMTLMSFDEWKIGRC